MCPECQDGWLLWAGIVSTSWCRSEMSSMASWASSVPTSSNGRLWHTTIHGKWAKQRLCVLSRHHDIKWIENWNDLKWTVATCINWMKRYCMSWSVPATGCLWQWYTFRSGVAKQLQAAPLLPLFNKGRSWGIDGIDLLWLSFGVWIFHPH